MSSPGAPNLFGGNPFDPAPAPVQSGGPHPTWVPSGGDEVNTLATLSVIFAFVFAPAGAVLGHLGLSQIARTRQRGRDRALVGVTLSYVFITAAIVALVVWAALGHNNTGAQVASAPLSTTAPAGLDGLLPTVDEARSLTADPKLVLHDEQRHIAAPPNVTFDRPECGSIAYVGSNNGYDTHAVTGFYSREFQDFVDQRDPVQLIDGVAAFHDHAAAQAQLNAMQAQWRRCSNTTMSIMTTSAGPMAQAGHVSHNAIAAPVELGNGVTSIEISASPDGLRFVHLIAAKADIVIDVLLGCDQSRSENAAALAVLDFILAKIPGPR